MCALKRADINATVQFTQTATPITHCDMSASSSPPPSNPKEESTSLLPSDYRKYNHEDSDDSDDDDAPCCWLHPSDYGAHDHIPREDGVPCWPYPREGQRPIACCGRIQDEEGREV